MNHQEKLRDLSQRLDIHFGVNVRKDVMSGNEKLTLATSESQWSQWMADVASRLGSLAEADPAKKSMDVQFIRQLLDSHE